VTVGVNAAVLGAITLGDNVKVGGGSVVVKDVPANATVVGVPARVVAQDGKPIRVIPDRPQVEMPDPTADAIARLQRTIAALERRVAELEQGEESAAEAWSWVI
jgi:serine O-acetyltransferase